MMQLQMTPPDVFTKPLRIRRLRVRIAQGVLEITGDCLGAEQSPTLDRKAHTMTNLRRLMRQHKVNGRKAGLMWWIDRDSMRAYLEKVKELGPQKFTPHSTAKE